MKLRADSAGVSEPLVAGHPNSQLKHGWVPLDQIHLVVAGAAAILFRRLSIGLPLLVAPVGRRRWAGRPAAMGYFACLGAGFIMLELVLIQLFMNLIGSPLVHLLHRHLHAPPRGGARQPPVGGAGR